MTAAEPLVTPPPTGTPAVRSALRPLLALGTGVAIEIGKDSLVVRVVEVRPNGVNALPAATIERVQDRPASEWVFDYRAIVKGHETSGVTVLLPRRDVIVRFLPMQGVSRGEMQGALALRLRSLHPFPEDDVAWCWMPAKTGALVGLMRLSTLAKYELLFAEAGIAVSSFTFSAAAMYSAARLYGQPALPALGFREPVPGAIEVYGENPAGVVYSSESSVAPARALAVAMAELRLDAGIEASAIDPLESAAIANACPLLLHPANFLPPERRAGQSRIWFIPSALLALLLIVATIALLSINAYGDRRAVEALRAEIAKVELQAKRASQLDKSIDHEAGQIRLIDSFRGRAHDDFEILNELTRILPATTWTSMVEIYSDSVLINGETDQAGPLLKALDSSPLFQNSEFSNSVVKSGTNEVFRIRTFRRGRR